MNKVSIVIVGIIRSKFEDNIINSKKGKQKASSQVVAKSPVCKRSNGKY